MHAFTKHAPIAASCRWQTVSHVFYARARSGNRTSIAAEYKMPTACAVFRRCTAPFGNAWNMCVELRLWKLIAQRTIRSFLQTRVKFFPEETSMDNPLDSHLIS